MTMLALTVTQIRGSSAANVVMKYSLLKPLINKALAARRK
jgi:hypothetical protein